MPSGLLASPGGRTRIMGVVNVTPDSFSDGGRFFDLERALDHARRLIDEGADVLDVGGESSRPGAAPVSEQEELDRVAPLVERLAAETATPVSIDTVKPGVARECLRLGARIVNDITALADPEMRRVTAKAGAAAVLMHMRGRPQTMQDDTRYGDLIVEIRDYLAERVAAAEKAGVAEIAVDPGIGFGKSAAQNFSLLRRLREFETLGRPILIGPSRKSFLGSVGKRVGVEERLEGTIAACVIGVVNGAAIVRVHDVLACRRALDVADAVTAAE